MQQTTNKTKTKGIYGIRMAGLAIAVGTWASIMIIVNFLFGIIIFHEPVHDILGTLASFLLLIIGLIGMSHYSEPQKSTTTSVSSTTSSPLLALQPIHDSQTTTTTTTTPANTPEFYMATSSTTPPPQQPYDDGLILEESLLRDDESDNGAVHYQFLGIKLNQRQCGIMGAVMNGIFTGGSLVPLHYAKLEGYGGANYIISMASGSFLANCVLWLGFYLYNVYVFRSSNHAAHEALKAMPRLYLKELLVPGTLAGILLAIAMFGSILAVTYLGQGVGNSLVQTKILVSGLWGIFFYKEITGMKTISMWFLSATISMIAIIWLSLERLYATSKAGNGGGGGGDHRFLSAALFET